MVADIPLLINRDSEFLPPCSRGARIGFSNAFFFPDPPGRALELSPTRLFGPAPARQRPIAAPKCFLCGGSLRVSQGTGSQISALRRPDAAAPRNPTLVAPEWRWIATVKLLAAATHGLARAAAALALRAAIALASAVVRPQSACCTQLREDLFSHGLLKDRRNDLQLAAAVGAMLRIDVERS